MHRGLFVLFLAGGALAQTPAPAVTTATPFGVLARTGTGQEARGVPRGHVIDPALRLHAATHDAHAAAGAGTVVEKVTGLLGVGVRIAERGSVQSDAHGSAVAGTSDAHRGMTSRPQLVRHGLRVQWRVPAGQRGVVEVLWHGGVRGRAAAGAVVDADGDGTPDVRLVADGQHARHSFRVTAGMHGVRAMVHTVGRTGVRGHGSGSYAAGLRVLFRPEGQGCQVSAFGTPCPGTLRGAVHTTPRGRVLDLGVDGATPNALGVIGLGARASSPQPLPASRCSLLLDLQSRLHVVGFLTDGNGSARESVPLPPGGLDLHLQAIGLGTVNHQLRVESTHGLHLVCR